MALSQSRLINAPSAKLTPTNSPRTPSRSPVRGHRDDHSLALKQVIGTTTGDSNAFDCLESGRCFAFTAGSAAVLATVDHDLKITKRFFRAKPTAYPTCPSDSIYDSPSFGASQSRRRTIARDNGFGALSPLNDTVDSSPNRSVASRERMKAATCISLSRDGQLLAVGETGYRPRVLVFSTAQSSAPDTPMTILAEHTFGVRCLAFSPDSQYLATLGDMNDGFLYIWSINRNGTATCVLINKCTSNIKHIAWLGSSLITSGTRHVKLWRIEIPQRPSPSKRLSDAKMAFSSPASKALAGRNLLLGPLLDKTFTAIAQLSPTKAIVCSDQGDVCILEDSESPRFYKIADAGFGINAITISQNSLVLCGDRGRLKSFDLASITSLSTDIVGQDVPTGTSSGIVAVASIGDHLVVSNSDRNIQLLRLSDHSDTESALHLVHQSPAHGGAVQGVHSLSLPNRFDATFYTWSSEGAVLFWSSDGSLKKKINVQLDQIDLGDGIINELKIVRVDKNFDFLATGDKFGVLRLLNLATEETIFETRAHSSEIIDIAMRVDENQTLIASSGRDRMVQLFKRTGEGCDLLQTLDEHVGAVTGVFFTTDGTKLVSYSADRCVVVRDTITGSVRGQETTVYVAIRTITLKTTPLSMDLHHNDTHVLISTVDRNIHTYDLSSGMLLSSFKTGDMEGGDAVIVSSVVHSARNKNSILIAGVSGTDKSIRVYDESGRLISRDYGHTEGMTGIAVVQDDASGAKSLVTVATDGTIFIWSLLTEADQMQNMLESLDINSSSSKAAQTLSRPPLRRVISSSEFTHRRDGNEEDSISPIASPMQSRQAMRRKASRLSMAPTPKLEPTTKTSRRDTISPVSSTPEPPQLRHRPSNIRSTSPTHNKTLPHKSSRQSFHQGARRVSSTSNLASSYTEHSGSAGFSKDLATATEQACKSLHALRKKLASSLSKDDVLQPESVKLLERELSLTARALAGRAKTEGGGVDAAMSRVLDQYSERLWGLLDERIENCVARKVKSGAGDVDADGTANSGTGAGAEEACTIEGDLTAV